MVVGLTGGMACGKSTVGKLLAEAGWGRVDSDEIVRTLLRDDREAIGEVFAAFGPVILAPEGGIDRRKLAALVFTDTEALRRLEGILHPRVRRGWKAAVSRKPPEKWVVEIPLLFEKGLEKEVDFTVCVACDPRVQAERLGSRGLSPQEASRRIARQLPLAQKIERADFVITNNGSLAFLRDQVTRLAEQLVPPAA
jgi:dephospho-CoA kinase